LKKKEPLAYRDGALFVFWGGDRRMSRNKNNGATLGFEETLWQAADKLILISLLTI
jgi:hypothetical protein